MVMSRDQKAGQNHSMKIDNTCSSFEMMEQLKYLGTTLGNQNSIQEESQGNASYHLVQNLLYFSSLSKNLKM
jgi:hypothetical protein